MFWTNQGYAQAVNNKAVKITEFHGMIRRLKMGDYDSDYLQMVAETFPHMKFNALFVFCVKQQKIKGLL